MRKYQQNPKNKARYNEISRNRRKTDLNYRMRCNLSGRINIALNGNPKLSTTMKLLGCSIEEFRTHLENQFQIGMNWDNHWKWDKVIKRWHIDHIKPRASFDLTKEEDQRACFHYSNLQPLWAKDNLQKSSKTK